MTAIPTNARNDIPKILDALDMTAASIEALGAMLELMVRNGEDMSLYSNGVDLLFRQQCEDLKNIEDVLRNNFVEMRTSKLEICDLDKIAKLSGFPAQVVDEVIAIATGVRLSGPVRPRGVEAT